MTWTHLDDRSGKILRMKKFYRGHLFHVQMSIPLSAGSLYSSQKQSQVWSQLCSRESRSPDLPSDAKHWSSFRFLIKMPTGCLFVFIPLICIHKLTNRVNNYCRQRGGYCWIKGSIRHLYWLNQKAYWVQPSHLFRLQKKKKKKITHSFIKHQTASATASHWANRVPHASALQTYVPWKRSDCTSKSYPHHCCNKCTPLD